MAYYLLWRIGRGCLPGAKNETGTQDFLSAGLVA